MIFEVFDHQRYALAKLMLPFGTVGNCAPDRHFCAAAVAVGICRPTQPVRLIISLAHDVKAHLVTQLVKSRIVRIMRGSNGVYIVPFHEHKVTLHVLD